MATIQKSFLVLKAHPTVHGAQSELTKDGRKGARLNQVALRKDRGNMTPKEFNEILKEQTADSDKEGYYDSMAATLSGRAYPL